MDALPMVEHTPNIPHKSKVKAAHMCGHDGHIATLLATAQIVFKNRDKIPKDKKVRLLF
jgi:metal-dependent amidase/aminoacylase/carboxypeptidase family protein